MPKPLSYRFGEQTFSAEIGSKVHKSDLYGRAKRVAEKDGKILERGILLSDGRLLPRSATGFVKADALGTPIEKPVANIAGVEAAAIPSSFDATSDLQSVSMTELALFSVTDVYPLGFAELPPAGLYQTQFNYRSGFQANEARVLVKADGQAWLLVGVSKQSAPLGMSLSYEFFDAESEADDDSDELDFSMI
jgi:hypothetical protein